MKAIICRRYGPPDVLELAEGEIPTPGENQVLVKVHASSINAGDWRAMSGKPFAVRLMGGGGLLKPKTSRLGMDLAGTVEAVGASARHFQPGDEVFGCARGAFAEYVMAYPAHLAIKPANRSFEQAAAVPLAGLTALQGLRDAGGIRPRDKVLIQGASGGVGLFAVQLARSFEAEVTAVCSTRNTGMALSLGADCVIDYTREDFTSREAIARNPKGYHLIFAVNGYHPLAAYKRTLSSKGVYVCAGGDSRQLFQAVYLGSWLSIRGGKKLGHMGVTKVNHKDLVFLARQLESGKIVPVIDQTYPLTELDEGMRYLEGQHAQGKVIITMD